jgi:hypothetical protein
MKTRIALGAAMLLTIGSAVAGTFIYAQNGRPAEPSQEVSVAVQAQTEVTPEMIAMWKSTAASSDYVMPRLPI